MGKSTTYDGKRPSAGAWRQCSSKPSQPSLERLPGRDAQAVCRVYSRSHWPRGRENKSSDSGKNQPGRTAPPPVFPCAPALFSLRGYGSRYASYSRSHWPRGRENKSSDSGKNQPGRTAPPPVFPCAPALFSLRGYGSRYASYSRSGWAHGRAAFAAPQVKPSPTARVLGFYLRSAPSVPMRLPPRYAMNWDGRPARWTGAAPALAASCKTPSGDSWAPAVQSRPYPAS